MSVCHWGIWTTAGRDGPVELGTGNIFLSAFKFFRRDLKIMVSVYPTIIKVNHLLGLMGLRFLSQLLKLAIYKTPERWSRFVACPFGIVILHMVHTLQPLIQERFDRWSQSRATYHERNNLGMTLRKLESTDGELLTECVDVLLLGDRFLQLSECEK
jgi:hypothetical protein